MENTNTNARKAAIDFLNAKLKLNKSYSDQKLIRITDAVELIIEFSESQSNKLDEVSDEAIEQRAEIYSEVWLQNSIVYGSSKNTQKQAFIRGAKWMQCVSEKS